MTDEQDSDGDGLEDEEEFHVDRRITDEPPNETSLDVGYAWSSSAETRDTDGV